jgi:UTP--glucose-1-phosphate uridylyltransferase
LFSAQTAGDAGEDLGLGSNNMMQSGTSPNVRKAVVPAAGLGTRHFPASHAVKKELFPVVGPDGVARALIHYHLIELVRVGIEQICIIVQAGDDRAILAYLQGPDSEYLNHLEKYPALLEEARAMKELARRVVFVVQEQQEGYGHAVFQTRAFAGKEPVLLCLGDHLFRGRTVSPYWEMTEAAAAACNGRSVSAVNRIGPDDLKGYGTIAGRRHRERPRLIDVQKIVEKPDRETARRELHVDGLGENEYLGWFGMHVLAPSIYDILGAMIRDNVRDNGEFQLTRAQEIQRQREGYLALEMVDAERFDFGTPDDFIRSSAAFRSAATKHLQGSS